MRLWRQPKRNTQVGSKSGGFEQAVVVYVKLSGGAQGSKEERDAIHRMTDRLSEAIMIKGVGEFDGDEFGGFEGVLFMYGSDADRLFEAIFPLLRQWPALKGGHAIKRYGPPGSRVAKVDF
jgi:hypothetical protein